jgi:hypothetical protein
MHTESSQADIKATALSGSLGCNVNIIPREEQ